MSEKIKRREAIRMECIDASAIGLRVREAAEGDEKEGKCSRTIIGRAIAFDSPSQVMVDYWDGPFREYVEKGAIDEAMLRECDIKMTAFHNREILLARHHPESSGNESSMKVELREDGVWIEFDAPNSPWGDNVVEAVRRGDMNGMSFSFYENDYKYRDEKGKDGIIERKISEIKNIFEMTVTDRPAYPATIAEAREAEEEEARKAEEKAKAEAEAEEKAKAEAEEKAKAEAAQREANKEAIRRVREIARKPSF